MSERPTPSEPDYIPKDLWDDFSPTVKEKPGAPDRQIEPVNTPAPDQHKQPIGTPPESIISIAIV